MNTPDPVLMWGNVALLFMALGFNIFAIYYGVKIKWTSEPLGPAVMALFGFLALTLDYFFIAAWIGDFPGRYIVRGVLLSAGAGAVFWHLGWLLYVQHQSRSGTVEPAGGIDGNEQGQQERLRPVGDEVANHRRTRLGPGRNLVDRSGRGNPGP